MQEAQETTAQILKALKFHSRGMTIADIARETGMSRNTAAKLLEILRVNGQVELKEFGTAKVYYRAQRVPLSAFLCFTKNLIVVLDSNHTIIQVNDQCLRLARRDKADLIGRTLQEANLPVVSSPEAIAIIEGLEKEQIITDLRYPHEGKDLFFQLQVIPTTFEDGEKGATLVLEDITERKLYVRNMEFLAKTAMELVDMPPQQDIYEYIAERISEIVPNTRCFVMAFDEVKRQFSVNATQDKGFHDGLVRILGREPVGLTMPLTEIFSHPQGGDPLNLLHRGLQEIVFWPEPGPEGMTLYRDIFFEQIPEEICEEIRSRWNLGKLCAVFLVWEDHFFGTLGIFLSPGEVLEDTQVVESFVRQASIAIARRQTEDRLRRSEQRFREVMDHSPVPASIVDADGRYIFINPKFTNLFGYTLADIPAGKEWFEKAFPDPEYRKEAVAAWKSDLTQAGIDEVRSRTFRVRCKNGMEKTIRFSPLILSDGNQYITYQETKTS